jgi:hypothetical protein
VVLTTAVAVFLIGRVWASEDRNCLPKVIVNGPNGTTKQIAEDKVYSFEQDLRKWVACDNGPDEIVALATSAAADLLSPGGEKPDAVRAMVIVAISGDGGELRSISDYGEKKSRRKLSRTELKKLREFMKDEKVDTLPPLVVPRVIDGKDTMIVGGTIHVFVHLKKTSCLRIFMDNPPIHGEKFTPPDDPSWKYAKVVRFFQEMKNKTK